MPWLGLRSDKVRPGIAGAVKGFLLRFLEDSRFTDEQGEGLRLLIVLMFLLPS